MGGNVDTDKEDSNKRQHLRQRMNTQWITVDSILIL